MKEDGYGEADKRNIIIYIYIYIYIFILELNTYPNHTSCEVWDRGAKCRGLFFSTSAQAQSIKLYFEGSRQINPSGSTVIETKGYGIGPLLKPNIKLAHLIQIAHVMRCRGTHQNGLN